jgi:hypothetical protein
VREGVDKTMSDIDPYDLGLSRDAFKAFDEEWSRKHDYRRASQNGVRETFWKEAFEFGYNLAQSNRDMAERYEEETRDL